MPEEKILQNQDAKSHGQQVVSFYSAQKSVNELYFQIASVFREVSQDDTRLAKEWMHRIIMDAYPQQPDNTDKIFVNGIEIR